MKVKEDKIKDLQSLGFEDGKGLTEYDDENMDYYKEEVKKFFVIGSGRRGQHYFLFLMRQDNKLRIYATMPDSSSGSTTEIGDIFGQLFKGGFIE